METGAVYAIRKNDSVIVTTGRDRGKRGRVLRVIPEKQRVIVEGVNLRWKHKKPTQQKPKGERIQEECSIHHSNVMLYDPQTKKGIRKRKAETK